MKLNSAQIESCKEMQNATSDIENEMSLLANEQDATSAELERLQSKISVLLPEGCETLLAIRSQNEVIERYIKQIDEITRADSSFDLTSNKLVCEDVIVASVAGIVAAVIDVFLVGSPEVVKIYKGGENFDGSVLTGLLRKIGNGENSKLKPIFDWFCEKFQVPYDISLKPGVVTPNNHRLRCFAHDPLFGIFFAIFDIFMGTTTCIDNSGMIRIIPSGKEVPIYEKVLAVVYYFGHLISDIYTARGLPIPGFFLTQFFTGNGAPDSIAKKAEMMYFDGYDVRHLASMSVPVAIKNGIIKIYLKLRYTDDIDVNYAPISYREILEYEKEARVYKMRLISDGIATSGNILNLNFAHR